MHQLRSGDRIALPLRAGQMFVTLALPDLLSPSATVVDAWQAHAGGDVLELHVVGEPGRVRGLSDWDSDAYKDPVPLLDRADTAPDGHLIGRERLTTGDRLVWLSDHDLASTCTSVVFELLDSCQVIYRSWQPQQGVGGMPILLNDLTREPSRAMVTAVQEVLTPDPPRTWAPRNPEPTSEWQLPATRSTTPQDWLPQLGPRPPQPVTPRRAGIGCGSADSASACRVDGA